MENKAVSMILRILRILLPCGALLLGTVTGSYQMPVVETESSAQVLYTIPTNYFDMRVFDSGNWCPMICMLMTVVTVIAAIVCCFKETENSLVTLTTLASVAMVACLGTVLFIHELTLLGWCIVALLGALIVIAAGQEMKLEDARKKVR